MGVSAISSIFKDFFSGNTKTGFYELPTAIPSYNRCDDKKLVLTDHM